MEEIFHHGIKGMKWGVRRTPEQLGHESAKERGSQKTVSKSNNTVQKNYIPKTRSDRERPSEKSKAKAGSIAKAAAMKKVNDAAREYYRGTSYGATYINDDDKVEDRDFQKVAFELETNLSLPNGNSGYLMFPNGQISMGRIVVGTGMNGRPEIRVYSGAGYNAYPADSDDNLKESIAIIKKQYVEPAAYENSKLRDKNKAEEDKKKKAQSRSGAKTKKVSTNSDKDDKKKRNGDSRSPKSMSLAMSNRLDFGEDTIAHYGVIGMKWGVRRTPEQLGHAPKSERKAFKKGLKADTKEYKQLTRNVAAAQKNVKTRTIVADRDEKDVATAEETYIRAIKKREPLISRRAKIRRENAVTAAEKFLDDQLEYSERSENKRRQAIANAKKAIDELNDFIGKMNDKYGSDNVRQVNSRDVTTGALWWKKVAMEGGLDVPMNLTDAPFVGRTVAARIVNDMERSQRGDLMNERLDDYERKKYA